VADPRLWRVGPASRARILSPVTQDPRPVEHYRHSVGGVPCLDHLSVEARHCRAQRCLAARA